MDSYPTADHELRLFRNTEKLSYLPTTPFWQEDYVYATDGRIAVRRYEKTPQPTAQLLHPHVPRMAQLPWSRACGVKWPSSYVLRGDKESAMIGGRKIAIKYARRIARMRGVHYHAAGKPDKPLAFANEAIIGLIMPMATN